MVLVLFSYLIVVRGKGNDSKSVVIHTVHFHIVVMLSLLKLRGWFLHVRQMIHHTTNLCLGVAKMSTVEASRIQGLGYWLAQQCSCQ